MRKGGSERVRREGERVREREGVREGEEGSERVRREGVRG